MSSTEDTALDPLSAGPQLQKKLDSPLGRWSAYREKNGPRRHASAVPAPTLCSEHTSDFFSMYVRVFCFAFDEVKKNQSKKIKNILFNSDSRFDVGCTHSSSDEAAEAKNKNKSGLLQHSEMQPRPAFPGPLLFNHT